LFTGLVEELASVVHIDARPGGANIELRAKQIMEDMKLGDSIAVNGVCLTVVRFHDYTFTLDAVPETLRKTNLGKLKLSQHVHVERAMRADGRFGGHIVSGHIDGVGIISKRVQEGIATVLSISASPAVIRYVVEKGSICVDGVSLTVMDVQNNAFRVSLIPHTGSVTTLKEAPPGTEVNLECDILAKYVERLFGGQNPNLQTIADPRTCGNEIPSRNSQHGSMDLDFLARNGFA
jgi:riboflavin synthase